MEKSKDPVGSVADYAASETQSTIDMPPPAYRRSFSNSASLAKTISYAMVAMTVTIGIVVLLAIYIQESHKHCHCSTANGGPLAQAFRRAEGDDELSAVPSTDGRNKMAIPLRLQLDDNTGQMIKNNHKAHVNCVIEKKKATQIIASEPKMLMTPYGNITTDPRIIHVTGERMIFSCSSGVRRNDEPVDVITKKKKKSKSSKEDNETLSRPRRDAGECSCNCAC